MLLLEAFFKFGSIGLFIGLTLLVLRDGQNTPAFRFSLPLVTALVCMFLTSGSENLSITGKWAVPLRLFDSLNTLFVWWFGQALFDDHFKLGKIQRTISALLACVLVVMRLDYLGFDVPWYSGLDILVSLSLFLLMLHLCYMAITGHQEDLLERRRRIRIWFAIAVAMVVIFSVVAEGITDVIGNYQRTSMWITFVFSFFISIWALLWLTKLHPEILAFAADEPLSHNDKALSVHDQAILGRLTDLMQNQRLLTNHGLSIADLSQEVGVPAHQLRKLINQTMGHRNFSSFLNRYRIQAVKESLVMPANEKIPILTLAMDAGFSSLAPFNRAFKASEGVTPSEYKLQNVSKTSG